MKNLLLINPNTSEATTVKIERIARHLLPPDVRLHARTARFGASYISCEASHAVAAHGLLDAWAHFLATETSCPLDGVLIGCFGDPGLFALRQSSRCPITGLAEASMLQASQKGDFAIVTGGVLWHPMLMRLAQSLGLAKRLKHIEIVRPTGAQLMADPAMALACLTEACQKAASVQGVRTIILGGAGLAGYASQIRQHVDTPIIDSVEAGCQMILSSDCPHPTSALDAFSAQWVGLTEAMQAMSFKPGLV